MADDEQPTGNTGAPVANLMPTPGMAPLTPSHTVTSGQTNVTSVKPSAGFLSGIRQGQMASQQEQDAAATGNEAQVQLARQQAALYQGQAATDEQYLRERQALRAEHEQRLRDAHADLDQRIQAASQDPTSFWDDRSSSDRILARIGVFLGAIGGSVTGGGNKALDYLNSQITADTEAKQKRGEKLMKLAETSKGLLADAYRQRAEDLQDVDAQHAAGLQMISNQAETYAKTMLPTELQAQGMQKVAQLKQAAAMKLQEAHEKLNTRIESQGGHTTDVTALNAANQPHVLYDPGTGKPILQAPQATVAKLEKKTAEEGEFSAAAQAHAQVLDKASPLDRMLANHPDLPQTEASKELLRTRGLANEAYVKAQHLSERPTSERQKEIEKVLPTGGLFNSPLAQWQAAPRVAQERLSTAFAGEGAAGLAPSLAGKPAAQTSPRPTLSAREANRLARQILQNPASHSPEDVQAARATIAHLKAQLGGGI